MANEEEPVKAKRHGDMIEREMGILLG